MNLIKSTGTFSFYTVLSRILGYFRDILIAFFLGTGLLADAFFVAFRIPNTFRRLFSEGTFNAAFIPSYTAEQKLGRLNADKFANKIFNLLLLILLILTIIIEIFMPTFVSLLAPGFVDDNEKISLAINLTRITFPFLLFVSLASFFAAILNSNNKFAVAAASPIILNVVLILTLFFSANIGDNLAFNLSYAVTISGVIQLLFLHLFVKKYFSIKMSFNLEIDKKVKFFFKKLLPSIFASGVTQVNILIGTIIASFQTSAVSYLYYADRVYQINLAIAGIAVGVVILPQLSKYIQSKNEKKINHIQNKAVELCLFLSIPASLALLIASEEIISALFGYGSFQFESVINSSKALFYFAFGLPAFALIKIFSSFFFANDDTKTPFYISLASVIFNVSLSLFYFREIGFVIIPIATSIASWLNTLLLFIFLLNRNLFRFNQSFYYQFIKIIIASLIMAFLFNYMINYFSYYLDFNYSLKALFIIIFVLFSFIFYLLVSFLIKAFKLSDIKNNY